MSYITLIFLKSRIFGKFNKTQWYFFISREVPIQQNGCPSRNSLPFIPQSPVAGGVATPFTVAGLPAYEKAQQKVHNNLCRFPPVLLDVPHNGRSATASPHKFELEQEMLVVGEQVQLSINLSNKSGSKFYEHVAQNCTYG